MSVHRSEHRIKVESGIEELVIFNPIGRIEVTGWGEPDIFLDYTVKFSGDPESSEMLAPFVETSGNRLVIQPAKSILGKGKKSGDSEELQTDFDMEDDGANLSDFLKRIFSFTGKSTRKIRSGVQISMNIRVPSSLAVRARNYNGLIAVSGLESCVYARGLNGPISLDSIGGPIDVQTLNGPVSLIKSTSPQVVLRTFNGPIRCYLEALFGPVTVKSVNGPIRVTLPNNADANLSIKTMCGPIRIGGDFSFQHRSSRTVQAVLNTARYPVNVKTTFGPITTGITEGSQGSDPSERGAQVKSESVSRARNVAPTSDDSAALPSRSAENQGLETEDQPLSLQAQIDRMLAAGKISADEAERLRKTI